MQPIINNPCPENWEGMTPDNQGRFCGKCSKIVIDFTKKTTQEIIAFLAARKGEEICGKLRKPALVPITIKAGMRVFTAAIYMVFGSLLFSSCGPETQEEFVGKIALDSAQEARNQHYHDSITQADSLSNSQVKNDSSEMDSATMMSTLNILDSIMKVKHN